MKNLLLVFALSCVPIFLLSQKLEAEVNQLKVRFYENDKRITAKEFRQKIEVTPESADYYRKFRKRRWWGGFIQFWGGIYGVAALVAENNNQRIGFGIPAIVCLGGGSAMKYYANRPLDKAFEIYNKEKGIISIRSNGIYYSF